MRRVCTLARFIPVERWQPRLFRSSLPLKLAKEIIVARHDFIHGRRGEERKREERMWEQRGRVVTRLRRLNITVNRAHSNSDAGAGATRKHLSRWRDWGCKIRPIPHREKGRKENKVGWINSKKRGISLSPRDRKD